MPRKRLEEFVELAHFNLDGDSIRLLPLGFCARNGCVVLDRVEPGDISPVTLGMVEPYEQAVVEALAHRWGRPVDAVPLNQYEVDRALDVGYPGTRDIEGLPTLDMRAPEPGPEASSAALLNDALAHAIGKMASDLHIEAYPDDVDVRIRVDGVLHQLTTRISPSNLPGVVGRVKALASLDLAERRAPQDGRFRTIVVDGNHRSLRDLRVSILPGPCGEDVVLRVLDTVSGLRPVTKLGLDKEGSAQLVELLENPEGLILVTGPTGSGKTTTLYSALMELQTSTRKVITAEDPIEYWLPKINQKQVGPKAGLAALTRAFLRQDPDVILVGEIRDEDTAVAAARAATTGHLVLSTLHSADPVGTIVRLQGLGLADDIIAEALMAVVAQRLARRNCDACLQPAFHTEQQEELFGPLIDGLESQRGVGCDLCRDSGYVGRIGLFEVAILSPALRDLLCANASPSELREELHRSGHRTLLDDALTKVAEGLTSLDEVMRMIPRRMIAAQVALSRGD
ncbi:MAG: type II/IV secretion system protein [Proteobacteria bacterium]|nr:type II/IV secretion system protein [Pseudomonadota bacterium]